MSLGSHAPGSWPPTGGRPDARGARRGKIALSLSGGGITAAFYEIGCLAALDDFLGFDFCNTGFHIYIGISAGASVSALLAKGLSIRKIYWGLLTGSDPALQVKRGDFYEPNRRGILGSMVQVMTSIPAYFVHSARNGVRPSPFEFMHWMEERLPPGLFSIDNFQQFISKLLEAHGKTDSFADLTRELYIPATDLDMGTRRVFSNADGERVPISHAVAASSAIPLFFRPFGIEGRDYIDGSTGRVAHIDIGIKNGASTVLIINPFVNIMNDRDTVRIPKGGSEAACIREKGMSFIQDQASRIETRVRLDGEIRRAQVEYPDVKIYRIEPSSTEVMMFLHHAMNYEEREQVLRYGYTSMTSILKRRRAVIEELMQFHGLTPSDEATAG
ncbi:MAG TPA: patatin-like phospholipase family protein [Candidatus Eisenbacteria bacterium]|jgi:predicted acylesterase/phospholipase RssA